jgi:hypothetical protein
MTRARALRSPPFAEQLPAIANADAGVGDGKETR